MKKLLFLIALAFLVFLAVRILPARKESATEATPNTWKRYELKSAGLSFQYPADWRISEIEPGVFVAGRNSLENPANGPVSIDVSGGLPYERAVEEIRNDLAERSERPISLAGFSGLEVSGRVRPGSGEDSGRAVIYAMLDRDGRLISVDFTETDSAMPEDRGIYLRIRDSLAPTSPPV